MRRHIRRPLVESLEGKTLLSVTGVAGPQAGNAIGARPVHLQHIALNGQVSGTWMTEPGTPDVGRAQGLEGSGYVGTLGMVEADGTIYTTGFIQEGHATGTMILSNTQGSVTIQLMGPPQPGFSDPPTQFSFKIVAATGQFAGDTGQGTATLQESPARVPVCPPGTFCPDFITAPRFTLTLHSA